MNKLGDLKLCCGVVPRLIKGENLGHLEWFRSTHIPGYAVVCLECGKGVTGGFRGESELKAISVWNSWADNSTAPDIGNSTFGVSLGLIKELNDAHEVLRSLAYTLGAGGYNATHVDPKVFHSKISDGIDMLTKPLLDRIEELEKKKDLPEGMQIVTTLEFEGCKYNLRKNGYVDVSILATGRGFTRHIHNIGLPVQQALENHLKTQKETSHG